MFNTDISRELEEILFELHRRTNRLIEFVERQAPKVVLKNELSLIRLSCDEFEKVYFPTV